jgi:hypothetical protein
MGTLKIGETTVDLEFDLGIVPIYVNWKEHKYVITYGTPITALIIDEIALLTNNPIWQWKNGIEKISMRQKEMFNDELDARKYCEKLNQEKND